MRLSPIRLHSSHRFFECERCGRAFTTRHIRSVLYGQEAITASGAKAGLRWDSTGILHHCQPRDLLDTVLFTHANFVVGRKLNEPPGDLHIYALKADGAWEEIGDPGGAWHQLVKAIFAGRAGKAT